MTDYGDYQQEQWRAHLSRLHWKQGEHVLVCGPTSAGKTSLVRPLLEKRSHVVALFTKLKDDTIKRDFSDFTRYEEWPKRGFRPDETRVMIWPRPGKTYQETIAKHRYVMGHAIDKVLSEGNRCLYMDEGLYLSDPRYGNLATAMGLVHYAGRSAGISAVTTAQRPFYLPKIILSSITHGYFARTRDKDDLKRMADIGSVDTREVAYNLARLPDRHDFIYLNPQGDSRPSVVNTRR